MKERSSEACEVRARFQQHGDASCYQAPLPPLPALQGKTPNKIHDILTETLACFLPGRAKDLSAPLFITLDLLGTGRGSIGIRGTQSGNH